MGCCACSAPFQFSGRFKVPLPGLTPFTAHSFRSPLIKMGAFLVDESSYHTDSPSSQPISGEGWGVGILDSYDLVIQAYSWVFLSRRRAASCFCCREFIRTVVGTLSLSTNFQNEIYCAGFIPQTLTQGSAFRILILNRKSFIEFTG